MNKTLRNIKQRVGDIQFGLLRVQGGESTLTLQVKVADNVGDLLSCLVTDEVPGNGILHKQVNLIQRHQDDYLYIAGRVKDEMTNGKKIISLEITRACWFVKKTRGSISWLQQKYVYEPAGNKAA
jgi:hypothetical protein